MLRKLLALLVPLLTAGAIHAQEATPEATPEATEARVIPEGLERLTMTFDDLERAYYLLYAVVGGGHNWPRPDQTGPAFVYGNINRDIDATEVVWDFFEAHTRPQEDSGEE